MTCSSACPGSLPIESDSAIFEAPPLLQSASSSEFSSSTRNEALRSGEGVPGAECTATRTIGSYKSQAGLKIILGSTSFGLGSHLQHTTAAVLRQSPPSCTLGLSRLRVRAGMYGTERRLDWEEFMQERATTTLKRSITLLELGVLRLPREWTGLWPWVPATLPRGRIRRRPWFHPKQTFFQPNSAAHTQLTPVVDT